MTGNKDSTWLMIKLKFKTCLFVQDLLFKTRTILRIQVDFIIIK